MRLVHMADLHIGFRQYQKLTADGINQREADTEVAFARAIDKVIELAPDVIVIGGDVFHMVRPSNRAILHAYKHFARLRGALPACDVVMVAGNHDTPRTNETGFIIRLLAELGVIVVDTAARRVSLKGGELSILAVPDHTRPVPVLEPDPSAKYNVLLMHDDVGAVSGGFRKPDDLEAADLNAGKWDYIALGHYHVYHEVAPNAFYSGSISYASSNIWREVDEESKHPEGERGKGIVERDLATGDHRFHLIEQPRTIVDLPAIDATGMTPTALTDAICATADACPGGIEDKVVRLIVRSVQKHVVRDLDHRTLRKLKARALNFLLDTRIPEEVGYASVPAAPQRKKRLPLRDVVRGMLAEREMSPGVDRGELIDLAMHYLDEVDKIAPATADAPEEAAA